MQLLSIRASDRSPEFPSTLNQELVPATRLNLTVRELRGMQALDRPGKTLSVARFPCVLGSAVQSVIVAFSPGPPIDVRYDYAKMRKRHYCGKMAGVSHGEALSLSFKKRLEPLTLRDSKPSRFRGHSPNAESCAGKCN